MPKLRKNYEFISSELNDAKGHEKVFFPVYRSNWPWSVSVPSLLPLDLRVNGLSIETNRFINLRTSTLKMEAAYSSRLLVSAYNDVRYLSIYGSTALADFGRFLDS
jgi:hypothetical protein